MVVSASVDLDRHVQSRPPNKASTQFKYIQTITHILMTGNALALRGQGQEGREGRARRPSVLPLWMRCASRLPVAQRRGLEGEDG